jgi:hypothetical protein
MRRVLILSAALATVAWCASAFAQNPLKGSYGTTGSSTCIKAGAFTEDNTFEALSNGPVQTYAVQGIRTFNGDGTGTVTASSMAVERPGGPTTFGHASSNTHSFSFTYTVNSDGTFTTSIVGLISGTETSGPRLGQTFTADFPTLHGQISLGATMLTLFAPTPYVETRTFSNGDVEHRICTVSRVAISLGTLGRAP